MNRGESYSVKLTLAPYIEGSDFEKYCSIWGRKNWRVNFLSQSMPETLSPMDKDKVLVLSPDAERTLSTEELSDDDNIFIIGGLIDRTVMKVTPHRHSPI